MKLYHYTCGDRAPLIQRDGYLKPTRQPLLGNAEMVWLTDLDTPDRLALGLTSHSLTCDRTDFRVVVDLSVDSHPGAVHWPIFAHRLPRATQWMRQRLELTDGARPAHWYVAAFPVIIRDIAATRSAVAS